MSSHSSRRVLQAAETRRVILDAALRLVTAQGYGATSVGQIAEEAGVAVPTVYASVGPKPAVLRLLLDRIDEEADIPRLAGEAMASDDPEQVLRLQVRITRQLAERCGDVIAALQSAAGVEPEMAETFAAGLARHRRGAQATVDRLVNLRRLRAELRPEDATAVLATLTRPEVYASLAGEFGWSFDQCEAWLQSVLSQQLLAQPRDRGGHPSPDSPDTP